MFTVEECREVIWLKTCMRDIFGKDVGEVAVNVDNQRALKIIRNPICHQRTKHIDVRLKYLRGVYAKNKIRFEYCPTEMQRADALTKVLDGQKTRRFRKDVGFIDVRE